MLMRFFVKKWAEEIMQVLNVRIYDQSLTIFITMKQMKKAIDGARTQLSIIFFIKPILTVFIPFTIPTPLIPPMIQYVVEMGIPKKVKSNTQLPAPS